MCSYMCFMKEKMNGSRANHATAAIKLSALSMRLQVPMGEISYQCERNRGYNGDCRDVRSVRRGVASPPLNC